MCKQTTNLRHHLLVLATSVTLAGCGGDDGDRYEKLDRLRVLGIRSEPADLTLGETAVLSAHVFEPAGRELGYEWSWCPSRGDSEHAFECNVSEDDWARAWIAAGLDGAPPAYALGTDREVELTHALSPAVVTALCQSPELDERVEWACFNGFEASLELTVQSSVDALTAIKSVPLLAPETPDAERNRNPSSNFELTVRDDESGVVIEADEALQAGHRYTIVAGIDEQTAESFTPSPSRGETPSGPRRETLIMTWFVTVGELVGPDGYEDGFGEDFVRTTFVDGSNDLTDLSTNGWEIPLTAGPSAALHLVLRDERGGTGWTTRSFEVVGGKP
jgi:hypothetical protein